MENYREIDIVIDRTQIYRSVMAEYALISAGKNSDEEVPMQYAKCDMEGIYSVIFMEEVGYLCSKLMGYVADCAEENDTLVRISMRVPVKLDSTSDNVMLKRVESYLVASTLVKCLMPVKTSQTECADLGKRARMALRSLRQMLAVA